MIFMIGMMLGIGFGLLVGAIFGAARQDDLVNENNRLQLELEQERWKSGRLG